MNGDSHSSTVIDAKTGEVIKTINLVGSLEFAITDGKGMIYANLANKNQVAAIDASTLEVKSTWTTVPSGSSTALAMDREHRRLLSAGRNPQMLVVMDADSGKIIQAVPISAGTDAAAYDPETKLVFVSTREGNTHIFHEDSADQYSVVGIIKTEVGAKSMGLDVKTHNLYLDTSDFWSDSGPHRGPPASTAYRRPRHVSCPGLRTMIIVGEATIDKPLCQMVSSGRTVRSKSRAPGGGTVISPITFQEKVEQHPPYLLSMNPASAQ